MSTPMSLEDILALASEDDALRGKLIAVCRNIDATVQRQNVSTREHCSGPLLDAVMRGRVFRKRLACGVEIEMPYGNKISLSFNHKGQPRT